MQHAPHLNIQQLIKAAYEGTERSKAAAEACDDGPEAKDKKDKGKEGKESAEKKASHNLYVAELAEKVAEQLIKEAERGELQTSTVNPSGSIPKDFGQGKQQQPLKPPMEGREPKTTTVEEPATPAGHKIAHLRYRQEMLKQALSNPFALGRAEHIDPASATPEQIEKLKNHALKLNRTETLAEAARNVGAIHTFNPGPTTLLHTAAAAAPAAIRGYLRGRKIDREEGPTDDPGLGVGRGLVGGSLLGLGTLAGGVDGGVGGPMAATGAGHLLSGYVGNRRAAAMRDLAAAREAREIRASMATPAPAEAPAPEKVAGFADFLRGKMQGLKTMIAGQPPVGGEPVSGPQHIAQSNQASIDATKGQAYAQQRHDLNQGQFQEPALSAAHDSTLRDAFHNSSGSKLASAQELFSRLQKEIGQ